MKFLSIAKPKDSLTLLPPALMRQIMEASMAAIKQLKKKGRILEAYVSHAQIAVAILDYNSTEEWLKDRNAIPILRYYNEEPYLLADMEEAGKDLIETLKAAESVMAATAK